MPFKSLYELCRWTVEITCYYSSTLCSGDVLLAPHTNLTWHVLGSTITTVWLQPYAMATEPLDNVFKRSKYSEMREAVRNFKKAKIRNKSMVCEMREIQQSRNSYPSPISSLSLSLSFSSTHVLSLSFSLALIFGLLCSPSFTRRWHGGFAERWPPLVCVWQYYPCWSIQLDR